MGTGKKKQSNSSASRSLLSLNAVCFLHAQNDLPWGWGRGELTCLDVSLDVPRGTHVRRHLPIYPSKDILVNVKI